MLSSGPSPQLSRNAPDAAPATSGPGAGSSPIEVRDRMLVRMLDLAAQPFIVVNLDGHFTHSNKAFQMLVGYSADELRAMTFNDLTPDRYRGLSEPHLNRLRETGITQRYEKVYRDRDGREIPVELITDLIRDEQGHPVGYFAFITDIGERKRDEDILRASEERFRSLYDEAPVGYHTIDAQGRIVDINRTECEMLGYSAGRDDRPADLRVRRRVDAQ